MRFDARTSLLGALIAAALTLTASRSLAQAPAPPAPPAAPSAPSAPPAVDDEEALRAQAKVEFTAGVAAYDAERFEEALGHFQEAFRIKPHPSVRVNMANCYDRLGKPLQAIFHFERFLEDNGAQSDQRREVMEALRKLRARVSEVTLRVNPDGASVTIDQGERRQAPIMEPVRLEAGLHLIEVALSGYESVRREVLLTGGQPSEIAITLERAKVGAVTPAPTPLLPDSVTAPAQPAAQEPVEEAKGPTRVVQLDIEPQAEPTQPRDVSRSLLPPIGWVTGGVTAGVLIAALITGQLALSAEADFESSREAVLDEGASPIDRRAAYADALDAADRADNLALASDVLLGVAIVGVGATIYFAISHHQSSDDSALQVTPTGARVRF